MSRNGTIKRFLPVLFFLCAGAGSSTLLAQTAGTGGDAVSNEPRVMLVGNDDGSAMFSSDGGNSWRLLDAVAAEQERRALARPATPDGIGATSAARRATAAPNPTAGATAIHYTAGDAEAVTITIYSSTGAMVLRSNDLALHPGARIATIDLSSVASGNYLFRIQNAAGSTIGEGNLAVAR
jgi:hypothetical protein